MYLNRIVTALTIAVGVIGAALPAIANLDDTSTAGLIGGLVVAGAAALKWLDGWQQHEAREFDALTYEPFTPDYDKNHPEGIVRSPGGGVTPPEDPQNSTSGAGVTS